MSRFRVVAAVALLPVLLCGGSELSLTASTPAIASVGALAPATAVDPLSPTPVLPTATPSPSAPSVTATPTPTPSKPPVATAPKPTPQPTPKPTTRAVAPKPVFHFPIAVSVGTATQIITVAARGSYATVTTWQHTSTGWHAVLSTSSARVGTNGVVAGSVRQQGTNTTPGGTFTLTEAFGIAANPGARLPYHRVTSDDWWVEDNNSAYYNQLRTGSAGGFNTTLPESNVNGSERLITHTTSYQYAVVINYNRWPAVHYKGAGIFLHVNGAGSTAGCVSVPSSTLVAILRWLDPAQHPRIAIA